MSDIDTTTGDPNEEYEWYNDDEGVDQCPRCGQGFWMEGNQYTSGPVVDSNGTTYDVIVDTDPMDAPFRCPECWKAHRAWERSQENKSIEDYV